MDAPIATATRQRALELIDENTEVVSRRFVRESNYTCFNDAPVWHATEKHLFDDAGLRPYWAFCWPEARRWPAIARQPRCGSRPPGSRFRHRSGSRPLRRPSRERRRSPRKSIRWPSSPSRRMPGSTAWPLRRSWKTSPTAAVATGKCCWPPTCATGLQRRLAREPAGREGSVLVSDPGRPTFDRSGYCELARYRVRTVPDIEHWSLKEAAVYCLR